jgi:hypothetical protein
MMNVLVVLVRTDVSEEYIVSIFSVTTVSSLSEDMPHDERRREPLAAVPPPSNVSFTVEIF